jgi:NADPH:quinone reductase-like Zn-dependent oxidoreductase
VPVPEPNADEVLIRIKAFGLNRSELFTRQGHSPGVKFPRILGIEACGLVENSPGGQFRKGQIVATAMGGMGRSFDGGYAEFTCVPANHVQLLDTKLDWEVIGAAPEMLQTSYGSLFKALRLKKGERLLIRGGTTSVGLAAASIAKNHGCFVAATTRSTSPETAAKMKESGVDQVLIDDGKIAAQLEDQKLEKVNKVLELVGTTTLKDSLLCVKETGTCCMTGMGKKTKRPTVMATLTFAVGNAWSFTDFAPMDVIPSCVSLTIYNGGPDEFQETPLNDLLKQIEAGTMKIQIGKVFHLDEIVEAHRAMEGNKVKGKIVILTA